MTATVRLPRPDGTSVAHRLSEPARWPRPPGPFTRRIAFAAAHVVPGPLAENLPGGHAELNWDATLGFRRHLWSYGLGVAEAMDTAQRNMGVDWPTARELIRRSAAEAGARDRIAAGAGTDHLAGDRPTLDAVVGAYEEQIEFVEGAGAQVIVMASRQLAAVARGADDYLETYGRLLAQVGRPVILHWLGPMFDPALTGYWGSTDPATATDTVVELIREHAGRIDGVKVSLLDAEHEIRLRRALPDGVHLYTGDDFNYIDLIRGDDHGYSDALLGVFAAIAPAASVALQALDRDDAAGFEAALRPTLELARHLFGRPTYHYKAGIAFLSWLAGHQPGFVLVDGLHGARSAAHLIRCFELADAARLFPDPDLAAARMRAYLEVSGVAA